MRSENVKEEEKITKKLNEVIVEVYEKFAYGF